MCDRSAPNLPLQTGILQGVGGGQPAPDDGDVFRLAQGVRAAGRRSRSPCRWTKKVGHSFLIFFPVPVPCRTVMYRSGARGVRSCAPDAALPPRSGSAAAARYRCVVQAICPWRNPLSMMRSILSGAGRSSRHERGGHGRERTVLRRATKGGRGSEPFCRQVRQPSWQLVNLTGCCRFPARHCRRTTGGSGIRPLSRPSEYRTDGSFPIPLHFAHGNMPGSVLRWRHWPSPANGKNPYHFRQGNMEGMRLRLDIPRNAALPSGEACGLAPRRTGQPSSFLTKVAGPPACLRRPSGAADTGTPGEFLVIAVNSLQNAILQPVALTPCKLEFCKESQQVR